MKIDGGSDGVVQAYAVRMEKISQNAMKQQGQGAVQLIQAVPTPPPVGADGKGSRVNTYA